MTTAAGTKASLRFCRETRAFGAYGTKGLTPLGVTTEFTGLSTVATPGSLQGSFVSASGNFDTSGYLAGHEVETIAFANPALNGTWVVKSVAGGTLNVHDTEGAFVTAGVDGFAKIAIRLTTMRATGRVVNVVTSVIQSSVITDDGLAPDAYLGLSSVVGAPGFELSSRSFDQLFELSLGGAFYPIPTITATAGVITGPTTVSFAGGNMISNGLRKGDRILLKNAALSVNDGYYIVTSVTATILSLLPLGGGALVTGGGSTVTLEYPGVRLDLVPGIDTFLMERAFPAANTYQLFNGCAINGLTLSVAPEAIVGGSFDIIGTTPAPPALTSISVLPPTSIAATVPYSSFEAYIFEGSVVTGYVTSLNLVLARNRSFSTDVSSPYPSGILEGSAVVSGTVSIVLTDRTFLEKFYSGVESSITISIDDPLQPTDFLTATLPRLIYTGATIDPPKQGPVIQDLPFRALSAGNLSNPGGLTGSTSLTFQRGNVLQDQQRG